MTALILCEIYFPKKDQKIFQKENLENIGWFLFNQTLIFFGINLLNQKISHDLSSFFYEYALNIADTNFYVQLIIIAIISDFSSYLGHRILHRSDFLWNFHKLHHSSETLTALSSLRHHWIEIVYHSLFLSLFTSWIIVDFKSRTILAMVMTFTCYFQHANLNLNLPLWVGKIFVTPENHRWHHSKEMAQYKGMNFGFLFCFWDKFFRSYYLPEKEPSHLGTDSSYPKNLFKRVIYPIKF
jgi:sterol desaturase/sphingolipid hydroxylase (fatty acid hydroxylase superfamily)